MTSLAASTYTVFATVLGTRYELSVTTRIGSYARFADDNKAVSPEQLAGMAAHTIATWQRVIEAVINGSFEIAPFLDKAWPSAQEKQGVTIEESEPFVTVWNKEWNSKGLGVTVHSWDNGTTALFTAYSMLQGIEKLAPYAEKFGIEKLEYAPFPAIKTPTSPTPPAQAPKPAASPDKDDIDAWMKDDAKAKLSAVAKPTKALNVYARPAIIGSLPNTIKLQKGQKGKESFEMAILATTPYHAMQVQYQEKDLVAYRITGKFRYEGDSKGFFFEIPVENSIIRIRQKEATQFDGKLIESDWQKLVKHLGLETHSLEQGYSMEVPATHIALKAGKIGKDDSGNDIQWKNYSGLYALA